MTTNNSTNTNQLLKTTDSPTFSKVTLSTGIANFLFNAPEGTMYNGRILPSVTSNNLTVALKTFVGTDPSATDPVYVVIGGVVRTITSALSETLNAGTNIFNAGSSELATKEVDYFTYLGWRSSDSTVRLGGSRIPYATRVADFDGGVTNEKFNGLKYLGFLADTDNVVNIGRFAATLSAGAGYTWSVPTYTASNLIQRPCYEMRSLDILPTLTWTGTAPTGSPTTKYKYKLIGSRCFVDYTANGYTPGTGITQLNASLPFAPALNSQGFYGMVNVTATPNATYGLMQNSELQLYCTSVNAERWTASISYDI